MARFTYVPDGKAVDVQVGERLVDACRREALSIPFSCENGLCGTCLSRVTKGLGLLNAVSEEECETLSIFDATPDQRLICQCVVAKDGDIEAHEP